MISYLEGKIIYKRLNHLILQCGHIGYKVFIIPTKNYSKDTPLSLYIHEHIAEDRDDLYGFDKVEELEIFEFLLGVSGLGPKIGMTVLSSMDKSEIEKAIERGDMKAFQRIKGIGQKMAAKIILELKSKIDLMELDILGGTKKADLEVEEALISLGYKKQEASKIIDNMPPDLKSIEAKVKWALRNAK